MVSDLTLKRHYDLKLVMGKKKRSDIFFVLSWAFIIMMQREKQGWYVYNVMGIYCVQYVIHSATLFSNHSEKSKFYSLWSQWFVEDYFFIKKLKKLFM